MENDYLVPPAPQCIERDAFLPFSTAKFGSQDYCMKQPQKTLAYAKVLQFCVEKAQLPMPGQPHQLAECLQELREAMELLMTFTDEKVLHNDVPSHWVKITSSRTTKPAEPAISWEWSCSRSRRTHAQGSFLVTHSRRPAEPTTTPVVSSLTISSQRAKSLLGSPSKQQWKPLPSFAEIARSLQGDNSPYISVEVPQKLTAPQCLLVGAAMAMMVSTRLHQDGVLGTTYLDMVTTSMSLVGLGATPRVVNHPMPTLDRVKLRVWLRSSPSSHFNY